MVNNNNGIPIEVNNKPFEIVQELKDEYQSNWLGHCWKAVEASGIVNKSLIKSLNPETYTFYCRNSSCDCYCSADSCICDNYTSYRGGLTEKEARLVRIRGKAVKVGGSSVKVKGFQHLIHTGNDWADKNGGPSTERGELWDGEIGYKDGGFRAGSIATSAGANAGIGGAIASGGAGYSMLGYKDSNGEAKFLSASVGGEIGAGLGGVVAGYSASADLASIQTGGFSANVGYDAGSGVSFGVGGVEAKVAGLGFSVGKKMGISTPLGGVSVDLEEACVVQ